MKRKKREVVETAWEVLRMANKLNLPLGFDGSGFITFNDRVFDRLEEVYSYMDGTADERLRIANGEPQT